MIKQARYAIKGIQRDLSVSKFSSEFAFDAMNIRLTARENNTLLSVTNEKGNKEITIKDSSGEIISIAGIVLGYCVLNNYLVLFTTLNWESEGHTGLDRIYRLEYKEDFFESIIIFEGKLNLDVESPIECIGIYENDNIQKVYWVDGRNQTRVVNITRDKLYGNFDYNKYSFDFVQDLNLQEEITVKKSLLSNGSFSSGTVQYAFTYYNKYGQESNIFNISELNYVSFQDRGANPEETVTNSFVITIANIDARFEYIRIYSIHRTSIDATPTVKQVIDLPITPNTNTITYTDNNREGETIDPTQLLYIGGESIIANTITHKDNTLFLGNITLSRPSIPDGIKDYISNTDNIIIESYLREIKFNNVSEGAYYRYVNQLNESTAGFKAGEHYRLGIQFQYKDGKWSEPIYIKDYTIPDDIRPSFEDNILKIPSIRITDSLGSLSTLLEEEGYRKARALVVFPSFFDRKILTQGMLCPTVFNIGSRKNNTPFAQSSWFIRPQQIALGFNDEFIDEGAVVEFRHMYPLFSGKDRGAEIQNMSNAPDFQTVNNSIIANTDDSDKYSDLFYVDQSVVTMHSPDIMYDDSFASISNINAKLRVVGIINFTASVGDIDIQTSSPTLDTRSTGFVHKTTGVLNKSYRAGRSLVSGLFYKDWLVDDTSDEGDFESWSDEEYEYSFMVYPWHRSGSLNNDINRPEGQGTRSAVLSKKKISNLKYSDFNTWLTSDKYWKAYEDGSIIKQGITPVQYFNSEEVSLLKLNTTISNEYKSINYYGNVDTLLDTVEEYGIVFSQGLKPGDSKPVSKGYTSFYDYILDDTKSFAEYKDDDIGNHYEQISRTREPVRMKYKTTPHLVFGFNYDAQSLYYPILPAVCTRTSQKTVPIPFWLKHVVNVPSADDFITIKYFQSERPNNYDGTLWIDSDGYNGDISKGYSLKRVKVTTQETQSGTTEWVSDDVVSLSVGVKYKFVAEDDSIIFFVATDNGEAVTLQSTSITGTYIINQDIINTSDYLLYPYLLLAELYRDEEDIVNPFGELESCQWIPAGKSVALTDSVEFTYGDTWYQRYDCMKTYPFTQEDENQIVEIASFMCETRVNIDGRYDRNRGQVSNLNMSPINFNLLNPVYSQKDNFFNYRIMDEDYYKLNKFPNSITWSKEKSLAEVVDTWTNITMASTLDLDGDKGEIISLNTFNNEIYCFQKQGFSNILFNSRVQIPSSDGVPIEITNGLKVSGKRYISNFIGCSNKWSIAETPSGIYFIDAITSSIYLFNNQLISISDRLGFSHWIGEQVNFNEWNPYTFENFRTHYDNNNGDVYFVNKDYALVYSESIGQFTSFMSYNKVPFMFNINNDFYSIHLGDIDSLQEYRIWKHFDGEYNSFFGVKQPYYITYIVNDNEPYDKIFNTVEYRADMWDGNKLTNETFDTLEVWNEYQYGKTDLTNIKGRPSSLKKKFRVWRANIPRDNSNNRDRIRNTWAYIKLAKNNVDNNYRAELHDMIVSYFI